MKDVVTRYTFDKCWPNSVNKSLSTMVLALKLLMYIEILPVLKVRLKFRLLKALPSSLNSFLKDTSCQKVRYNHYFKIFKKYILFPYLIKKFLRRNDCLSIHFMSNKVLIT